METVEQPFKKGTSVRKENSSLGNCTMKTLDADRTADQFINQGPPSSKDAERDVENQENPQHTAVDVTYEQTLLPRQQKFKPSDVIQFEDKLRRKMLASQLAQFVVMYRKETNLLSTKMTGKERIDDSEYCLPNKSFQMFLAVANENALEELLTVYTKTNKSAALFLGTRSESEPESGKGSRRQQISDRSFLGDVEYQEPVVPKSETWRDILKQSSDDRGSLLLSDRYNRSLAATSVNTSPYATSANVNPYASQNQRPMSAYSRLRETAESRENKDQRSRPLAALTTRKRSSSVKCMEFQSSYSEDIRDHPSAGKRDELYSKQGSVKAQNHHKRQESTPTKSNNQSLTTQSSNRSTFSFRDNGISSKPVSSCNSSSRGIDTMGSVDANRTFEIFVKQGGMDFDKRNLADDTRLINEIFQSTGTQTVDSTQYDGNSSYFSHRENKRVDEQVRRAQRAHYNAYLKQLAFKQEQESTQTIRPRPPSKPPAVKKPVSIQRMARLIAASKNTLEPSSRS